MTQTLTVPLDELAINGRARVVADACPVLVALVEGAPYAVEDSCRHRQASLLTGVVRDGVVTCPSHFWQYDLRTGARHDNDGEGLPAYPARFVTAAGEPTTVQADAVAVEVDVPDRVEPLSLRAVLLAHARATPPAP